MKLSDLYESSKEAQLAHLARELGNAGYKVTPPPMTHGQFLAKVKDSTMSQHEIDAVEDAMFGISPSQKITRDDLEQISAIADVDLGELLSIAEIDLRESVDTKKTTLTVEQKKRLLADFKEWSGGHHPSEVHWSKDSEYDDPGIQDYIEYALPTEFSEEAATKYLEELAEK